MTDTENREDTTVGGVTWHCSEEDGGPDVGISVYLGPHCRLWCGEISKTAFEELDGPKHFDGDGGWFIVLYNPEPTLVAKCADPDDARSFIEQVAFWLRETTVPTMAKTLGDIERAQKS